MDNQEQLDLHCEPTQIVVAPKKQRKPDPIWDALFEALRYEYPITENVRGQMNKAVRQLKQIGASPEDIRRRADNWEIAYGNLLPTPTGLINRWADLTDKKVSRLHTPQHRDVLLREHEKPLEKENQDAKLRQRFIDEGIVDANGNPIKQLR